MREKEEGHARAVTRERWELVRQIEDWLELPMLVLGFVWLALLIIDLTGHLSPFLEGVGTVIWAVFILDFALKLLVAPDRLAYLRSNWLTALALLVPALRVFRVVRVVRLFRATRAARGVQLFRVFSSTNRGVRALRRAMGRRGFGYVLALTTLVTVAGAAGMYAFEHSSPGSSLQNYPSALWWTAMLMTTMGSEYWPKTAEGRVLCLMLALYAFAGFGYVTATLATFFIGRDAEDKHSEVAGAESVEALRREIRALREEVRALAHRETGAGRRAA
ncbi:MAG TPA: ion transporter [Armatimonadota bacterium]|nr:ion transporter [Armatimonadota bacterium]